MLNLNKSESSVLKKAWWSQVKFSFKKFVRNNCFKNNNEKNNSNNVVTERFATSKSKKQLKISKVSDWQSRMIFNFQTTLQLH